MNVAASARTNGTGIQRYTGGRSCPVCGGSADDKRGQGARCVGFVGSDGKYARCTREEHAGSADIDTGSSPTAYVHKLSGECRCGQTHGYAPEPSPKARKGPWKPPGDLDRTFVYQEADGRPNLKVDRYKLKDGRKAILQSRPLFKPDGTFSRWMGGGIKGVKLVPYRLPKLVELAPGSTVYIVEGEPKVEAIEAAGLVATCNAAGALKWKDEFSPHLKGMHVVILPDNDEKGKEHGQAVARSVHPHAASVKVVELPGLPAKGDVIDWIVGGRTIPEMEAIAVAAPAWQPPPDAPPLRVVSPEDGAGSRDRALLPLTDLGNGERMVRMFGDRVRYCHPWNKWLAWDGRRWAVDNSAEAFKLAKRTVRSIYREAAETTRDDDRKDIAAWAKASEHKKKIEAMVFLAAREEGISVVPGQLDQHPWLLNVRNGTIDLRAGTLRPHSPADLITKLADVDFDPDAESPLWNQTLNTFLVDDDLIQFWRRLCGYSLTGVIRDQILPIAWGDGANGKSTILGTMLALLGSDYSMKASPDLLMQRRGVAHPTERASLFGKRLVVAIETEEGHRINESLIKELTGNDRIAARRMREDPWEFDPTHKMFLATNHKPEVGGTDHAIWRRLKLIPFAFTMPSGKAKLDMAELLKAELPGILAWCVRGCLEWQRSGLGEPDAVVEATRQYRDEEDTIASFYNENTTIHSSLNVRASALYKRYEKWAENEGISPNRKLTQKKFGPTVLKRDKGITKSKSNGTVYSGIGLRSEGALDFDPDAGNDLGPLEPLEPSFGMNFTESSIQGAMPNNGSNGSKGPPPSEVEL